MASCDTRTRRETLRDPLRAGSALRRLWDAARHGDFARVAIVMSRRLGMGLMRFERFRIMKRSAWTSRGARSASRAAGLETSLADRADLSRLRAAFPHNASEYESRMRRGDRCVVVRRVETPVAMTWVRMSHTQIQLGGCRLHLPADACWISDTFVEPAMRGYGLFHTLMSAAFAEVRRLRLSWTFLAVHHENIVSVRAHEGEGYAPALVLNTLNVGWARWHRLKWPSGQSIWRFGAASSQPRVLLA